MNKAQQKKEQPFEVILVCARCKHERSVIVTQDNRTKPPKPCKVCGCQEWKQKE